MGKKIYLIIVSVFLVSAFHGSIVYGENSVDAEATSATQLETITVTAQKVEEAPHEVPISMDVFSDTRIEDDRILNTPELVKFCPNVSIKTNPFGERIVGIFP